MGNWSKNQNSNAFTVGAQILWWKHAFVHEWIDLLGYTLYQEWVMWATGHAKAGLDL